MFNFLKNARICILLILMILCFSLKANSMEMIEVKLEQKANTKELLIHVTNKYKTDYFMDQMLLFKSGKITLDCIIIHNAKGEKLCKRIYYRMLGSKFPDDYIKLKPNQTYFTSLDLDKFFDIKSKVIEVQYSGSNSDPIVGYHLITSEILTMHF